jgi:hypothetical protein|tara:strand:- start:7904 stop:8155 length:252 start_codon:yes stop_codon:yes gene_type:complete
MARKNRDEVAAEAERDRKRREEREKKRDDKQDHRLDKIETRTDKIDAKARKAEAVAKKRKWLVILIAVVIGGAVFVKKYFFGG